MGFASCENPSALQAICDRFGPGDIQDFFDLWTRVIPTPFTDDDGAIRPVGGIRRRRVQRAAESCQWITASLTSTMAERLNPTGRPGRLSQLSVEKIVRQICHNGQMSSQGHFRLNP